MTGDLALDRIDRCDDPLKLAEDAVEELRETAARFWRMQAEAVDRFGADNDITYWLGMIAARHETIADRAQLAAEADDELPYR